MVNEVNKRLINDLNKRLASLNSSESYSEESGTPIFIIGLPRSGTTVIEQAILQVFKFGYIDNIAAKFWSAPEYGIALSSELLPFDERNHTSFRSEFGFTSESFGPHEFGYFWKRFFSYEHGDHEVKYHISEKEKIKLRNEVLKLCHLFDIPFIFKNPVALTLNASLLAEVFPEALFVLIEREEKEVINSLIKARNKVNGNINEWFSGIPNSCNPLPNSLTPVQKVCKQVLGYQSVIEAFKSQNRNSSRMIRFSYNQFCNEPLNAFYHLKKSLTTNNINFIYKISDFDENMINKMNNDLEWEQEIDEALLKFKEN